MTSKEKAEEIFEKMYLVDDPIGNYPMCFETARQCALIAVDELYDQLKNAGVFESLEFWKLVKKEIKQL